MTQIISHKIQQRTFIKLAIEDVYNAVTTPKIWNSFFTTGMEIDLKEGGAMKFKWENWGPDFYTLEVPCKVLACDKPKLFAFEWGSIMVSTVEFHLASQYGGTVITLKEYGYPNTENGLSNMLDCASGWGEALTLMKFYLEHGIVYTQPDKNA